MIKTQALSVAIAAILWMPTAAFAHAELVKSEPVKDGTLSPSAKEITLTFNETVQPAMCKLTSADGKETTALGKPRADGMVLHVPIEKPLAAGNYSLGCRVVGPDSHPMNSSLSFAVSAPNAK